MTYQGYHFKKQFYGLGKYEGINRENNFTYIGFWRDGKPDGLGIQEWPNGNKFYGSFKEGLRNGFGIYEYSASGNIYEGVLMND